MKILLSEFLHFRGDGIIGIIAMRLDIAFHLRTFLGRKSLDMLDNFAGCHGGKIAQKGAKNKPCLACGHGRAIAVLGADFFQLADFLDFAAPAFDDGVVENFADDAAEEAFEVGVFQIG